MNAHKDFQSLYDGHVVSVTGRHRQHGAHLRPRHGGRGTQCPPMRITRAESSLTPRPAPTRTIRRNRKAASHSWLPLPPLTSSACILRVETFAPSPLSSRRAELEKVVENDQTVIFPARRLSPNGLEPWEQVKEKGYEGMVGKDEASPYKDGRTLSWIKVRQKNYRVEERGWDARTSRLC